MLLGIDLGTQALKVLAVDEGFVVRGRAHVPITTRHPGPGRAEQDPAVWLAALRPGIRAALEDAGASAEDVLGLAVTGQLDGALAVDRRGEPLSPALIWMDRRAVDCLDGIDPTLIRQRCGQVADPGHPAAKIRWLVRHHELPEGARFHQPVSFLVERLTGAFVQDHALASTSMLYALAARDWDGALCERFGIDPAWLPAIAEPDSVAGVITAAGAVLTGLLPGTPVAVGTGDDFTAALGAGVTRPGRVMCCVGTAEIVGAVHDTPVLDPAGMVETHGFPGGRYFVENPGWLSGGAVVWLRDLLACESFAALDALAETAPPGCDGLCVLPTLSGAMTPVWRAEARGAVYGLTPGHGRGHLARALLEGTAIALAEVVDRLDALGVATGRIRLVGGGARSRIWTRIRAAATGRPIELVDVEDAAGIGAVACAAVVAGAVDSLEGAADQLVQVIETIDPDPAEIAPYTEARARARTLFDTLLPLMDRPWTPS